MRPSAGTTFLELGILLATLAVGFTGQAQTLGEALNAANLNWTTGGNAPWLVETNITHDAEAAVATGNLTLGQANWIQTTVTGPTAVNFWWKVSSCTDAPLGLLIGGTLQTSIAGEIEWQERSLYVPAGSQSLEWTFTLNCTSSGAQNTGWLDQISFSDPVLPTIVSQPTNQTVMAGAPFAFAMAAAGTEPFAYQWLHAGTNLPGITASSFSVADAQAAHGGDYVVVVTGPLGAVTSQVATLTVTPTAPLFTVQPVSQGASIGSTMSFTAAAKGSEPIGWQWYSNGVAVAGASSATMSITNIQTSSFGSYWAVARNGYGSTTSVVATLSYCPVLAWGDNSAGQCMISPGATNVVALCGGDDHALGLRADGTVVAWGSDYWYGGNEYFGQADVPDTATNVVGIAAGSAHSLAVRANGTVVLWGKIVFDMVTDVPPEATNVVAVALGPGAQHAMALRADGTVLEWGDTNFGLPNVPASATNVIAVAAGAYHGLALRGDGTVVAWGDNSYGQTRIPASATNVVAIASGWFHNLALRANGTLVGWSGRNSSVGVPSNISNVVAIACGGNHSLVLQADGKLLAWGDDSYGQATIPPWATNVVALGGGSYTSMAVTGGGVPLLSATPASRSVLVGGTTYFRVMAMGSWPLVYQWQLDGTNLPGAVGPVLVVSNAQPAQAGVYSVVVSNALGTVTSPGAFLTVLPKSSVILSDSLTMTNGQFSFRASGPAGLKWSVQASTNLVNWLDLATLTNTTGTLRFSAPTTGFVQRFYRLRLVP